MVLSRDCIEKSLPVPMISSDLCPILKGYMGKSGLLSQMISRQPATRDDCGLG